MKQLDPGFAAEVDAVDQRQWSAIAGEFADANLLQTWSYGVTRGGRSRLSHLFLKRDGRVVAAVQVRLAGIPSLRLGLAYIRWGPLWQLRSGEADSESLRQILRAIRNEYVHRRGLVIRLLPHLFEDTDGFCKAIFEEEGYTLNPDAPRNRTIVMDVRPSLADLERGFHQKWRKHLNRARKNNLEIIEGEEDSLFEALDAIYQEMVQRKQFEGSAGIAPYRNAQQDLAPSEKLRIVLCKADGEVVAGSLFSARGDTAVDLFRATSNRGVMSYASYLVQWKVLEHLKERGCHWYNLNGINPVKNPGGYQFKSQLAGKNGRDVFFLGPFDAYPNAALKMLTNAGERFRASLKRRREPPSPAANSDAD